MEEKVYSNSIIRIATVVQIEDNLETNSRKAIEQNRFGRRIKVRLYEDKQNLMSNDLIWAWPLLPKHLQITPKIGENVLIFFPRLGNTQGNRFYIGPIISQDYFLNYCGQYESMSLLNGLSTKPSVHPKDNPKNDGSYPDKDTIALQGRGDSAMWLKNEELRLLCGHKPGWGKYTIKDAEDPGTLEFNNRDLGYIQLRYDNFNNGKENFKSVANIIADRINLVTHNGALRMNGLNVTDSSELMTTDSIIKMSTEGERMVYGDKLIAFLNKFRDVFKEHMHHWLNDKQVELEKDGKDFWNKDLEELLCKTIRLA